MSWIKRRPFVAVGSVLIIYIFINIYLNNRKNRDALPVVSSIGALNTERRLSEERLHRVDRSIASLNQQQRVIDRAAADLMTRQGFRYDASIPEPEILGKFLSNLNSQPNLWSQVSDNTELRRLLLSVGPQTSDEVQAVGELYQHTNRQCDTSALLASHCAAIVDGLSLSVHPKSLEVVLQLIRFESDIPRQAFLIDKLSSFVLPAQQIYQIQPQFFKNLFSSEYLGHVASQNQFAFGAAVGALVAGVPDLRTQIRFTGDFDRGLQETLNALQLGAL